MAANFVVQNDDGDAVGANAYIDGAFMLQYFLDIGTTLEGVADDYKGAIVAATRYIDRSFAFSSYVLESDQTTQFPRKKWVGVPIEVKYATAEYAKRQYDLQQLNPAQSLFDIPGVDSSGMRIKGFTKKVGPIEKTVSYDENSYSNRIGYPPADDLLAQFISGGSGMQFDVFRA